jgi:hypothetical protein
MFVLAGLGSSALAASAQFPSDASFTTRVTIPLPIEGLTGDNTANLYVGGSGVLPPPADPSRCPIWQINLHQKTPPPLTIVGYVPLAISPTKACNFSGIAFDAVGNLYQADGTAGTIYLLKKPNAANPPDAEVFAKGVPGTNGIAFDRDGNLWTGDGTTGEGRVWRITGPNADCTPPSPVNCEEVFRIQPMRNGTDLGGEITAPGVGRQNNSVPLNNAQNLVANGIAFNHQGDMFVIDTARGALWKVQFDRQGNLQSPTGCDTTFAPDTLCLSNVFVASPILEGGDGIALDVAGNIWVAANERNAVAVVTKDGTVTEIFRNPVNASGLRNSADPSVGNNRILEFPTSPFLSGKTFCTSQSDGNRRDNSPNTAGEIPTGTAKGKISCMDQDIIIPGLPLPVH